MRRYLELPLKLFIITLVAGICLGATYYLTKEPIAKQRALAAEKARNEAYQGATFEPVTEDAMGEVMADEKFANVDSIYKAVVDGKEGYVVTLRTKGYAGDVEIIVGVDADLAVTGVVVGKNSETPGLGANAKNPSFRDQFVGSKNPQLGQDIDAMTGATITSKAVTDGVNIALEAAKVLQEVQGE